MAYNMQFIVPVFCDCVGDTLLFMAGSSSLNHVHSTKLEQSYLALFVREIRGPLELCIYLWKYHVSKIQQSKSIKFDMHLLHQNRC